MCGCVISCLLCIRLFLPLFFFFNDTATTEIYTLSLHDALPISRAEARAHEPVQHHATSGLPAREVGWLEPNRRVQHSGQPVHDHASEGDAGSATTVHTDRGAVYRQIPAGRREPVVRSWWRGADLDHLVHASQHPRRPRRGRADVEYYGRQPRVAAERLHTRRPPQRRDSLEGMDARSATSGHTRPAHPVAGWWLLQ